MCQVWFLSPPTIRRRFECFSEKLGLWLRTWGLWLEDSDLRTPTWGLRLEDPDLRTPTWGLRPEDLCFVFMPGPSFPKFKNIQSSRNPQVGVLKSKSSSRSPQVGVLKSESSSRSPQVSSRSPQVLSQSPSFSLKHSNLVLSVFPKKWFSNLYQKFFILNAHKYFHWTHPSVCIWRSPLPPASSIQYLWSFKMKNFL